MPNRPVVGVPGQVPGTSATAGTFRAVPGAGAAPVCSVVNPPATGVLRRLFPVPAGRVDAARTWLELGSVAARRPRRASSVLLVRDAPEGVSCWLGLRGPESPLGIISFAGGSCAEQDEEQVPWFGPSPAKWAAQLGLSDHMVAKAHVLAAVRELFEETGVLLAGRDELSLVEDTSGEDWMRARQALAADEITFPALLAKRGWGVRTDLLRPVSHWISPAYELRRFDTYYFAAAAPTGQDVAPLATKARWGRWVCAKEAGAHPESTAFGDEIDTGETRGRPLSDLATPATQIMLEKLRRTRGCVAYLSSKRQIQAFQPELVEVEDRLLLDVTTVDAAEGSSVARGR